jgi:hypothetical protein
MTHAGPALALPRPSWQPDRPLTRASAGKAKGGEGAAVDGSPAFLRAKNLEPFISNDLIASTTPMEFVPLVGPGYQGRAVYRSLKFQTETLGSGSV